MRRDKLNDKYAHRFYISFADQWCAGSFFFLLHFFFLGLTFILRFLELGSILDPGKPPKMDKAAILSDAVRVVTELRSEGRKLKESNESLQEKIKELKVYL